MENLFNITNLKSLITFIHLAGLALGVGGAWILDSYIVKNKANVITDEKYQFIEFVSKLVLLGLTLLWASGVLFLLYYYNFSPEALSNEKIWGKVFIVTVLTINGYLIHTIVIPKMKAIIGSSPIASFNHEDIQQLTLIGVVSFVSWLFPIILGVAKTLNHTTSAIEIILFYFMSLAVSALIASLICNRIFFSENKALNS